MEITNEEKDLGVRAHHMMILSCKSDGAVKNAITVLGCTKKVISKEVREILATLCEALLGFIWSTVYSFGYQCSRSVNSS